MIDRAQRLGTGRADGDHGVKSSREEPRCIEQGPEEVRIQVGHVAGCDEIPRVFGYLESRQKASERTITGQPVGNHRNSELGISGRIGNNRDISRCLGDLTRDVLDQGLPSLAEQGFVASHTSAAASGEYKTGGAHAAGLAHEKMIALPIEIKRAARAVFLALSPANRMVYICFLLFWGIMTSAGLQAASVADGSHAATTVVKADTRTGRLVRSVIVNPKVIPPKARMPVATAGTSSGSQAFDELVEQAAKSYDVDPLLVHSVIQVESNYNPYALSNKGAEGLMQLIPATARRFGVKNSFDSRDNIDAGVRYLKYLKNIFGDDRLALAAYNAGEGAVARYGWIPPYPETQQYVYRVGKKYGEARRAADRKPAPASVLGIKPVVEEHPKLEQYRDEQGRVCLRTN